ncbi:hypothetical protein AVEN_134961-1 [Araneus ventricosus]|uniref:Uncharacterized protein n=1 Tax=Araneus ventricosus TaxID=182803 RepID=A0A4Y2CIH5_ARAVE|nr:hypothetical protein AVEN_134961-1 [Araneus ventricosus]
MTGPRDVISAIATPLPVSAISGTGDVPEIAPECRIPVRLDFNLRLNGFFPPSASEALDIISRMRCGESRAEKAIVVEAVNAEEFDNSYDSWKWDGNQRNCRRLGGYEDNL